MKVLNEGMLSIDVTVFFFELLVFLFHNLFELHIHSKMTWWFNSSPFSVRFLFYTSCRQTLWRHQSARMYNWTLKRFLSALITFFKVISRMKELENVANGCRLAILQNQTTFWVFLSVCFQETLIVSLF